MRIEKDEERENRIHNEAIIDAYSSEEQVMGWYYYLDDKITFPFKAECINERKISPLREGEEVEVLELSPLDDCQKGMYVQISLINRTFGVPLEQLKPLDVDEDTQEAIEDWHYWVGRGYTF